MSFRLLALSNLLLRSPASSLSLFLFKLLLFLLKELGDDLRCDNRLDLFRVLEMIDSAVKGLLGGLKRGNVVGLIAKAHVGLLSCSRLFLTFARIRIHQAHQVFDFLQVPAEGLKGVDHLPDGNHGIITRLKIESQLVCQHVHSPLGRGRLRRAHNGFLCTATCDFLLVGDEVKRRRLDVVQHPVVVQELVEGWQDRQDFIEVVLSEVGLKDFRDDLQAGQHMDKQLSFDEEFKLVGRGKTSIPVDLLPGGEIKGASGRITEFLSSNLANWGEIGAQLIVVSDGFLGRLLHRDDLKTIDVRNLLGLGHVHVGENLEFASSPVISGNCDGIFDDLASHIIGENHLINVSNIGPCVRVINILEIVATKQHGAAAVEVSRALMVNKLLVHPQLLGRPITSLSSFLEILFLLGTNIMVEQISKEILHSVSAYFDLLLSIRVVVSHVEPSPIDPVSICDLE